MRALAYLLGARALDAGTDADRGIRWPKPQVDLPPVATTNESAAAWRRWRDQELTAADPELLPTVKPALQPNGA
jgi:hypothetical protein